VTAEARAADGGLTRDAFLGGHVMVVQPKKGHRAGLDAALLQALVPAAAGGRAVDLGAGVGTIAFCAAARATALSVVGVERDPGLVACGREALSLPENASFAARVRLVNGDAGDARALAEFAGADWVLMNPPFDPKGRGTRSPEASRRDAHVAAEGLLRAWCATAEALLKPGATLGLIHRADALAEVLGALSPHFGDIRVLPVHPTAGAAASRILVSARRGRRTPLAILPGFVLHEEGGAWTEAADRVLRGKAELAAVSAN
jgi:tRNA1(Val) A37 N6-methylase TrmN6